MKKTMALFGLLIMAVLTTAASCSHTMIASLGDINNDFSYTEIQEQQIDFANKTRLDLSNDAGEITINGWDQPYIQMVATIRAKSERALARAEIDVRDQGNTLKIEADHPSHGEIDWLVDFELSVPNQADVYVSQGAGTISIFDLTGVREVELGAGEIMLDNIITSSLQVDLGAGEVSVTRLLAQSIEMGVGTGDLRLEPDPSALFDRVQVDVGMGEASLVGIRADRISANVGMGDLNIGLFSDASYQINADVGMGDLDIDGFSQMNIKQEGLMSETAKGTLGDGQGSLEADVGIGSLRVYVSN